MQLDHAGERVELRVFVDERGVVALCRRRHKRIREGNLVRRLELRRLVTERFIRVQPVDGLLLYPGN